MGMPLGSKACSRDKACKILHSGTKERGFTLRCVQSRVPWADAIWAIALHNACCSAALLFPDKMI